jgi:hypothetical protein
MAITASLNESYCLDLLNSASGQGTLTVKASDITDSYNYFDSPAGYIVKSILVTTIAGAGGAKLDVYTGSIGAGNKLCAQVLTAVAGTVTQAALAPVGALATANLTIASGGEILIVTSGANSQNRVQITIGLPNEKSVTTTFV